jgi:4-hydroxy-3-methylbut-2-enyl diphosphate reductase
VEDVADVARVDSPRQTEKLAVVTQTTLSVDDAAEITSGRDGAVSPASSQAQAAGHLLRHPKPPRRRQADEPAGGHLVIVVGSPTSSNSNRWRELARKLGVDQLHGGRLPDELAKRQWFEGKQPCGPDGRARRHPRFWCSQVMDRIRAPWARCRCASSMDGIEETVKFPLPKGLEAA